MGLWVGVEKWSYGWSEEEGVGARNSLCTQGYIRRGQKRSKKKKEKKEKQEQIRGAEKTKKVDTTEDFFCTKKEGEGEVGHAEVRLLRKLLHKHSEQEANLAAQEPMCDNLFIMKMEGRRVSHAFNQNRNHYMGQSQ